MDEGTRLFLKFRDILHGRHDGQYSEIDFSKIFPKSAAVHNRIDSLKKYLSKVKEFVQRSQVDQDGLCLLLDAGLSDLMVQSVAVVRDLAHIDGVTPLLDELLDIVNVIADFGPKVHALLVTSICGPYLQLLVDDGCSLLQKTEICRSLNILLETCPFATKEELLKQQDFIEKLEKLFQFVIRVGDYESQVGILECLFRLVPRKFRALYAKKFIQKASLDKFLDIRDVNFETDCRMFLNELNGTVGKNSRVYSVPCERAIFGKKELKKPSDDEYEEFWVDFNFGTRRITLFCEQDMMEVNSQGSQEELDLWETVSVSVGDVKAYSYTVEGSIAVACIELKEDISILYPNMIMQCSGKDFDLFVNTKFNMKRALMTILGSEKCKYRKVSSVITPVQLNVERDHIHQTESPQRGGLKKKTSQTDFQSCSQRSSEELTSARMKVSVPCMPMSTPAGVVTSPASVSSASSQKTIQQRHHQVASAAKIENQCLYKSGSPSTNLQETFVAPKTPNTKPARPKVKTPVVEVKECPKRRRGEKKKKQKGTICVEKKKCMESEDKTEEDEVIPDSFPVTQEKKTQQKLPVVSGHEIDVTGTDILVHNEDKISEQSERAKMKKKDSLEYEDEGGADFKDGEKRLFRGRKPCGKEITLNLSKDFEKKSVSSSSDDKKKTSSQKFIKQENRAMSCQNKTPEESGQLSSSQTNRDNVDQIPSTPESSDLQSSSEVKVIQETQDAVERNRTSKQVLNKDIYTEVKMGKDSVKMAGDLGTFSEDQEDGLLNDKSNKHTPTVETDSSIHKTKSKGSDLKCETGSGRNDKSVTRSKTTNKENNSINSTPDIPDLEKCNESKDDASMKGNQVLSVDKQTRGTLRQDRSVLESHTAYDRKRCGKLKESGDGDTVHEVIKENDSSRKHVSPRKGCVQSRNISCRNDNVVGNLGEHYCSTRHASSVKFQDAVNVNNNNVNNATETCNKSRQHSKKETSKTKSKRDEKSKPVASRKKGDKRTLPSRKAKENQIYDDEIDSSENGEYLFVTPHHRVKKQPDSHHFDASTKSKAVKPKNSKRLLSQSGLYFPELSNASTDSDPYDFDAECDKNEQIQANMCKPVNHQKGVKEVGISASKFFKHRSETRKENKSAETIATSYMKSWQQKLNKKKSRTHVLSHSVVSWKSVDGRTGDRDKNSPLRETNRKKGRRTKTKQKEYVKETSVYSTTRLSSVNERVVENHSKIDESFVAASRRKSKQSKFRLFNPDLSVMMPSEQTYAEIPEENCFPDRPEKATENTRENGDKKDISNIDSEHKTSKEVPKSKKQQKQRKVKYANEIQESENLPSHACRDSPGNSTCESSIIENFSAICKTLIEQSSVREETVENDDESDAEQCLKSIQKVTGYSDIEDHEESLTLANDLKSELSWIAKKSAAKKKKNQKTYKRQRGWKGKRKDDSDEESDVEALRFRDGTETDLVMSSQEWEAPIKFTVEETITPNIVSADTPKLTSSKKRYSPLDVKFISTPKTPKTPGSYRFSDDEIELYIEDAEPLMDLVPVVKKLEVIKEYSLPLKGENATTLASSAQIQSGPSSTIRPSRSSLKRKYSHLNLQDDEISDIESSPENELESEDNDETAETRFCPRKLFRMDNITEDQESDSQNEQDIIPVRLPPKKDKTQKRTHPKPVFPSSSSDHHTTTEEDLCTQFGDIDPSLDFSDNGTESGISTVVQTFGIDIQKQLQAKYQQIKEITRGALKNTQKHINQVWTDEYHSRGTAMEHFKDKMLEELLALEADVTLLKDAEDKSLVFCQQQKKAMEKHRVSQETRLRNLKLLYSSLQCSLQEAEDDAVQKQQNLKYIMKKDLTALQKKLLSDSNQHHISNVKRCLKNMLF